MLAVAVSVSAVQFKCFIVTSYISFLCMCHWHKVQTCNISLELCRDSRAERAVTRYK